MGIESSFAETPNEHQRDGLRGDTTDFDSTSLDSSTDTHVIQTPAPEAIKAAEEPTKDDNERRVANLEAEIAKLEKKIVDLEAYKLAMVNSRASPSK